MRMVWQLNILKYFGFYQCGSWKSLTYEKKKERNTRTMKYNVWIDIEVLKGAKTLCGESL